MTTQSANPNRIPSLDGLRAMSVCLVLLGHLSGTHGFPLPLWFFARYAELGVQIFFVISGFLITQLLIRQHERTGIIDLKAFYVRRAYRILPAAYVYVACVIVFYSSSLRTRDVATAVFYVSNYIHPTWVLGHLWSLSVEEQFYLLWPFAMTCAFRKRIVIAAFFICACPLFRVALYFSPFRSTFECFFPAVADALATGCLLAIFRPRLQLFTEVLQSRWMLSLVPLTLGLHYWKYLHNRSYQVLGLTLIHTSIALLIDHVIRRPYRILNVRPVVWVGVLSYSLYLCQQPFLNRDSGAPSTTFPLNIILAVCAAVICHYAIERPFLALRLRRACDRPREMRTRLCVE
jgi:peptidoglycan/LPS O-acetylase OafA/YrhL